MSSYNQAVHLSAHILKITHFCRNSSNEYQEAADAAYASQPALSKMWEATAARRCSFTEQLSVWLRRYGIEEFSSGSWVDPFHLSLKPLQRVLQNDDVGPRIKLCIRAEKDLLEEVRSTVSQDVEDSNLRQLLIDMELHIEQAIVDLQEIARMRNQSLARKCPSLAS